MTTQAPGGGDDVRKRTGPQTSYFTVMISEPDADYKTTIKEQEENLEGLIGDALGFPDNIKIKAKLIVSFDEYR